MSYASLFKPAPPFFPMPNTGTILDISAGSYVKGHKGQWILNGGVALFAATAALPNMFKSTIAAGKAGAVMRAFPKSIMHAHDSEATMSIARIERLVRYSMMFGPDNYRMPEDLLSEGRLFATSSVDYNLTELFSMIKKFCKDRWDKEERIQLEIIDTRTGKPYEYFNPVIEFWDSFSGMKAESAEEMLEDGDVGTKDLNMLAMRVNSGKSQVVDQLPDLAAKHGIYFNLTAHVGQQYQLNPHQPNVKVLRWLKGDVKLKRVPENFSFHTGNCYVISQLTPLTRDGGVAEYPYEPGDNTKDNDLIEIRIVNMRGKFGPSNIPLILVVSQKDGWIPYMSNFLYLKDEKYGINGQGGQHFALALMPEYKMQRTTLRQRFRESYRAQKAALHLAEMRWMFSQWDTINPELICTPTELYEQLKTMGYDWDLLLNTRFWHGPVDVAQDVPYLSTMDLLMMRIGKYHPYWYPKSRKEMGLPEIEPDSDFKILTGSIQKEAEKPKE